jgi:hypothetical protein
MVLGFRLSSTALLLAACTAPVDNPGNRTGDTAPAAATAAPVTGPPESEARVGGRMLKLVMADGGCGLDLDGTITQTGIAGPCGFLRPKAGAPAWTHDYGARGAIVLIGGPPSTVTTTAATETGRKTEDSCSDEGVAVIVAGGKVALATLDRTPLWFCPNAAPDEKYYYGIAHQTEFAKRKTIG